MTGKKRTNVEHVRSVRPSHLNVAIRSLEGIIIGKDMTDEGLNGVIRSWVGRKESIVEARKGIMLNVYGAVCVFGRVEWRGSYHGSSGCEWVAFDGGTVHGVMQGGAVWKAANLEPSM